MDRPMNQVMSKRRVMSDNPPRRPSESVHHPRSRKVRLAQKTVESLRDRTSNPLRRLAITMNPPSRSAA
jgi:hypothetical protein